MKEVVIKDVITGIIDTMPADGVFVYIGNDPQTQPLQGQVNLNPAGYVLAGEDTKTNVEGVFAAGDVRTKEIRQIATATADGAVAAIMAEKYIAALK